MRLVLPVHGVGLQNAGRHWISYAGYPLLFASRCAEATILLNEAGKHTLKIDDKLKDPFK